MTTTVSAGDTALLSFQPGALPFSPGAATLGIVAPSGASVTPLPVVFDVSTFTTPRYIAAWDVPHDAEPGLYVATLTGTIDGEPASVEVSVYVQGSDSYLPVDEFKVDFLRGQPSAAVPDSFIIETLSAVSGSITGECCRSFHLGATETRTFRTDRSLYRREVGEGVLPVSDIAFPEAAVVEYNPGGTSRQWYTIDHERLHFERNQDFEGSPAESIVYLGSAWSTIGARVRVTAQFGWAAVPSQVAAATRLQSRRILARRGAPEGVAGPAEWGLTRTPRLDPDVRTMLVRLHRVAIA